LPETFEYVTLPAWNQLKKERLFFPEYPETVRRDRRCLKVKVQSNSSFGKAASLQGLFYEFLHG
jgi:hypothetical protein